MVAKDDDIQHHTVKSKLLRVWKPDKNLQFQSLQQIVLQFNRVIVHATHFFKWYLLNCLVENQIPITAEVFEFIIKLLNNPDMAGANPIKFHLIDFIQMYQRIVPWRPPKIKGINNTATYHSRLLFTNFIVNIKMNFAKMLKRFISCVNKRTNLSAQEARTLTNQQFKIIASHPIRDNNLNQVQLQFVTNLTNRLQLPVRLDMDKNLEYDVASQPLEYINSYQILSTLFESEDFKNFNFVPLSTSLIPRHITIDTTALCKMIHRTAVPQLNPDSKHYLWSQCFKLGKKEFKPKVGWYFDGMIRTDGVSISILFKKYTPNELYAEMFNDYQELQNAKDELEKELKEKAKAEKEKEKEKKKRQNNQKQKATAKKWKTSKGSVRIQNDSDPDDPDPGDPMNLDAPIIPPEIIPAKIDMYFQEAMENPALKADMEVKKKVFIDPNKRDLIYCLGSHGEDIQPEDAPKFRYTSMQRRVETGAKEFRKTREKATAIHGINAINPTLSHKSMNRNDFNEYLIAFFDQQNFDAREKVLFYSIQSNHLVLCN